MSSRTGRSPLFEPMRRRDLISAGVRDSALRRGDYHRVIHGIWVRAEAELDLWTRIAAVRALTGAQAVVSHATAAMVYGLPVPYDAEIHITLPRDHPRPRTDGVRPHLPRIPPRTHGVDGVRITTPEQTFLDLARPLGLVDLVAVGDALVAKGMTTPERLMAAARAWRGHGATSARRAARYVRAGVESPRESRVRMLMVLAGLPEPTVNTSYRDASGAFLARFDLSYGRWRLAIEYDGRQHAQDTRQWRRDLVRREHADSEGWRLVIVTDEDLNVTPGKTLARILAAMHAQGMPAPKRPPSRDWAAHFPGR